MKIVFLADELGFQNDQNVDYMFNDTFAETVNSIMRQEAG